MQLTRNINNTGPHLTHFDVKKDIWDLVDYRTTNDYSCFSIIKENRGIHSGHVEKLCASMREHGWISSSPMTVRLIKKGLKGERFEVLDGQHRFEAAKRLELPVKFIVMEGDQALVSIADLNKHQKQWSMDDYCRSHANKGNKNFKTLIAFKEKHKLRLTPAYCLLTQGMTQKEPIKNGELQIVCLGWAETVVGYLKKINSLIEWSAFTTTFVRTFVRACQVEGFDPGQLLKRIKKNPSKLVQWAREKDIRANLEEVYNHRSRKPFPLAFEISKVGKSKKKTAAK